MRTAVRVVVCTPTICWWMHMPIGFKAKLLFIYVSRNCCWVSAVCSTPEIHPLLYKITSTQCISRVSYTATPVSTEQAQAPSKLTWNELRTGYSKTQGRWIYSSQDGETRVHYCILKAQDTDWDKKIYFHKDSDFMFHWVPGQITHPAINMLRQNTRSAIGAQERRDTDTVDVVKNWDVLQCCQTC